MDGRTFSEENDVFEISVADATVLSRASSLPLVREMPVRYERLSLSRYVPQ